MDKLLLSYQCHYDYRLSVDKLLLSYQFHHDYRLSVQFLTYFTVVTDCLFSFLPSLVIFDAYTSHIDSIIIVHCLINLLPTLQ